MESGEQFGPANTELMQGWIAEGRVPVESWVWRTGWPAWKSGGEAITFLNGPVPPAPDKPPAMPPGALLESSAPAIQLSAATKTPSTKTSSTEASATVRHRLSKRNRQARARKATFFLGGLVVLLLAVLVILLMRK